MSDLSRKEMTQEILDTLLMVENELFFGGNHEDAKARIDRCRSHLKEAQLAKPDEKLKEDAIEILGTNLYARTWEGIKRGDDPTVDNQAAFNWVKTTIDSILALLPDVRRKLMEKIEHNCKGYEDETVGRLLDSAFWKWLKEE